MCPSRKALLLYIVFQLLLNQRKPHTIKTVAFHLNLILREWYTAKLGHTHKAYFWANTRIVLI